MNTENFNKIIHEQIERCENTLCKKADEYAADDDRLHNFKVAAGIQNCLPTTALGGMMAKHTVSVYDMIRGLENGMCYPIELWNEKITDSINYLLLLAAAVREDEENFTECECFDIVKAEPGEERRAFLRRIASMAEKRKCDIYGIHNGREYRAVFMKTGLAYVRLENDERTGV